MKITYDKDADAINMILKKGIVAKTIEITHEIMVDLDKKGKPLYIEILGVSEKVGKKNLGKVTLGSKTFKIPTLV